MTYPTFNLDAKKLRQDSVKINYIGNEPKKGRPSDAAYDLVADEFAVVGVPTLVKTRTKVAIPPGYVGLVCSRSGLALKGVFVVNAPGVIDPGYTGDVGVILASLGEEYEVNPGDRVAQLLIVRAVDVRFTNALDPYGIKDRGDEGFGSSGD